MPTLSTKDLLEQFPEEGRVEWIGLRPARREPVVVVSRVEADRKEGLIGDRFAGPVGAPRQVSLIQFEHLRVIAELLRRDAVDPKLLRRNLVISGINLTALKGALFSIGDAVLKGTGGCAPCSRMEYYLGTGGYNAMRGHGGIVATVASPGVIRVGDRVLFKGRADPNE